MRNKLISIAAEEIKQMIENRGLTEEEYLLLLYSMLAQILMNLPENIRENMAYTFTFSMLETIKEQLDEE